jgi:hypothetical protein
VLVMTSVPHVLFNAAGEAVNLLLLEQGSSWQPPDGFTTEEPDFDGFGMWLLTAPAVQQAYTEAQQGNPLIAGVLQPAVLAAVGNDLRHLRTALLLLRRQGLLSADVLQAMAEKAAACHLPEEFINALGG